MDSKRFDRLVQSLGQTRSRRQTLRGLAGAALLSGGMALASVLVHEPDALAGSRTNRCLTSTDDLQAAIDGANPGATLRLCEGTWTLSSPVLIDKNLTLTGAGAGETILDGGDAVRVLEIGSAAKVALRNLTITKGSADYGAGIVNDGSLTLFQVSVKGNAAPSGNGGGIVNSGTLTLQTGSRVKGNTADSGGGIFSSGTVTLETGSHVKRNTATNAGGGIWNHAGTMTLQTDSSVTGNTAPSGNGGGIYNFEGTVTLRGDLNPSPLVVDNCADNCAGTPVTKCALAPVSC